MKKFNEKFHTYTKDAYLFIKLKEIVCNVRTAQVELHLLYAEDAEALVEQNKTAIEHVAKKVLASNANVVVKFVKSHFDAGFFKNDFLLFLKDFPTLAHLVDKKDINVSIADKSVSVHVEPSVFEYCIERKIADRVDEYLYRNYSQEIAFAFVRKDEVQTANETQAPAVLLEAAGGRYIIPQNIDALIGKPIYSRAMYIEDARSVCPDVTVCGTVEEFQSIEYKDKKTGEPKVFYKLKLKDYTGTIEAIFFPYKNSPDKITLLKQGKQIVIRGGLEPDYRRPDMLTFKIKDISYCTLPADFVINRFVRPIDTEYRTVFPVLYQETAQGSLFDAPKKTASNYVNKTYVVFDLETTGLNPNQEKIVEIGAVKIVNGVFTETFSTLVNPGIPIPPGATAVHHITDSDVEGKPAIELALPDFYKFAEGAVLVAHNIAFDYSFIEVAGKPMGIYFEHEKLDTLYLARKMFPHLSSHNLPFLTKHFNIDHIAKHRAVDDCIATAKLLTKIFETMDK